MLDLCCFMLTACVWLVGCVCAGGEGRYGVVWDVLGIRPFVPLSLSLSLGLSRLEECVCVRVCLPQYQRRRFSGCV